jgi:hypothetical protein
MRKMSVGLLTVALVSFAALSPLLFPGPSLVPRAALDRIEEGMTQADFEAVFGVAEGDL